MQVKDSFEGSFVFNTERFRLDYLQDLKKEANQRAQAQAAIVSLLLPTLLLLADHLAKEKTLGSTDMALLVSALFLLLGSLSLALIVLVPVPTRKSSKFSEREIPGSSLVEQRPEGGFRIDVDSLREEARQVASLLRRRDRLLRASAVLLGGAIALSTITLVRYVI